MSSSNKTLFVVLGLLAAALLLLLASSGACSGAPGGGGGGGGAQSNAASSVGAPQPSLSSNDIDYSITAEEFLSELSNSTAPVGRNARDAATSANVPTGTEAAAEFKSRGFEENLLADFSINGDYTGTEEVDASTAEKRPSYLVTYISTNRILWLIYINDGSVIATPLSNDEKTFSHEIILIEGDYVTQYDGIRNEFSDFAPEDISDAVVARVNRIDKDALDAYTFEQLEALQ